ncbi:hypothetical protein GCM10010276_32200 [Streptomyces longisporus]|uniref:Uncharacterized protein n=1 Tax=Streptomyces longisporus TaxID=1948 RepID=A0ABN3LUR0_STRLO
MRAADEGAIRRLIVERTTAWNPKTDPTAPRTPGNAGAVGRLITRQAAARTRRARGAGPIAPHASGGADPTRPPIAERTAAWARSGAMRLLAEQVAARTEPAPNVPRTCGGKVSRGLPPQRDVAGIYAAERAR